MRGHEREAPVSTKASSAPGSGPGSAGTLQGAGGMGAGTLGRGDTRAVQPHQGMPSWPQTVRDAAGMGVCPTFPDTPVPCVPTQPHGSHEFLVCFLVQDQLHRVRARQSMSEHVRACQSTSEHTRGAHRIANLGTSYKSLGVTQGSPPHIGPNPHTSALPSSPRWPPAAMVHLVVADVLEPLQPHHRLLGSCRGGLEGPT